MQMKDKRHPLCAKGYPYPPIQKLTLMVKNRHYLWTIL